jgi:hypothetical protein
MGLEGSCSDESIEHDDVTSWQHERDKHDQERRLEGNVHWIPVAIGEELRFKNDFSAFGKNEAIYFFFGGIPEVRADELKPEPWDASGSLASYAAGSQIAAYRDFKRSEGRERRGRKKEGQVEVEFGLPAPPSNIAPLRDELNLELSIDPKVYKAMLRLVRDETSVFSRWGAGAEGRGQWQKVPIATKVKISEGMLPAELLDRDDEVESCRADEKVVEVKTSYEMARATVNAHPALARALAKLLAAGHKDKVRELMIQSIPRVVEKFEQVTGRKVVGLSIHWDSDLPHWNLWHSGLEKVIFRKGKGADRVRYRRTAMNLNSSGPGLRAWRRSQLAHERLGKPTCPSTMNEISKAEKKAMEDQGRMPGDWQINDAADAVLEELLLAGGYKDLVDEGFFEFVSNEENRYEAGLAGKVSRLEKMAAKSLNRSVEEIAERDVELEGLKASVPVDGAVRKLVAEFFMELAKKPRLLKFLRKVPVLRHLFQSLADLLKVDLKFDSPEISPLEQETVIEHVAEVPVENSVEASVSRGRKGKNDQGMEI